MSDWSVQDIVKAVLGPVFGIVGGWVTASIRTTNRVTLLEGKVLDLTNKQQADHNKLEADHEKRISSLSTGMRLALESNKSDLEEKIHEVKDTVEELEKSFNQYTRSSHHDFTNNEEFQRFTREWQQQCQKIQRTLGQIEGMMQKETLLLSRRSRPDSDPSPASEESPRIRR